MGCLNALRIEDVSKRLYPYVIIGDDGVIRLSNNDSLLLKKFFTINQLSEGEQDNLTKTMLEKYRCILDVFRKARILEVEDGHKYRRFVAGEVPFADKNCILFDYSAMCTFSTKNYKTLERNYKKAFTVHANSYDNWNIGSPYSRRLLLCYCVECGLKCLIMENDNIYTISQADDETAKILGSHDFRTLLKRVGQAGTYRFKSFPTEYGNTVGTADYHQLCRYLIAPAEQNITYLQEFDYTLAEIKEWLKEVV